MSAMRRFVKRSQLRFVAIFATPLIFLSVQVPVESSALTFKSVPAQFWGHVLANNLSSKEKVLRGRDVNLEGEIKSEWRITFSGFPTDAKEAVRLAIDIWSRNFESKVPINVEVIWEKNPNINVLGSARPVNYFNDFAGAPDKHLWYPSALANVLAGRDLDSYQKEITLKVNSTPLWHLDTNSDPLPGSFDLASVVVHEIAHGLGFLSNAKYDKFFGTGYIFQPTSYDAYVQVPDGRTLIEFCSRSSELGKALIGPLVWSGSKGTAANGGARPRLYSPNIYEEGSSITHLDEETFSNSPTDSMLTPNLEPGEVVRSPGPIVLGMLQDMLSSPNRQKANPSPTSQLRAFALVGDSYALIDIEPSDCGDLQRNSNYVISILPGGRRILTSTFPTRVDNLRNGQKYRFQIRPRNANEAFEPVLTNFVTPQNSVGKIKNIAIRPPDTFAINTFGNLLTIVFADAITNSLKIARLSNGNWQTTLVRKSVNVGHISTCVGRKGNKEILHVVYADRSKKDLILSTFTGRDWYHETVDGDGESVLELGKSETRKTSSDVSVSNTCVSTASGLQVFYRDETIGILRGATKTSAGWVYEVIDGDKSSGGRTTGDVAFQLSATVISNEVFLIYDSLLTVNSRGEPIQGEMRLARRKTVFPEDWTYKTLDGPRNGVSVAGFATAIHANRNSGFASWLQSDSNNPTKPNKVAYLNLINQEKVKVLSGKDFGSLDKPLSISDKGLIFACSKRLCYKSFTSKKINLLVAEQESDLLVEQVKHQNKLLTVIRVKNKLVSITI